MDNFFIKDLNHSQIVKIINDIKKFMGVNNKLKKDDDLSKSFIKIIKGKKFEKLEKFLQGKPIAEQEIGRLLIMETIAFSETSMCRRKYLINYFVHSQEC